MASDKTKGVAYYLGAVSTFATFIGIEAYNRASFERLTVEDELKTIVLGIPAVVPLPMGHIASQKAFVIL